MKIRKTLITLLFGTVVTVSNVSASGFPVFDVSGWLTAVDQLYSQYDMVINTVTQIENQYQQIQQAIERAKSIDWDNISFDGDWDIRNDIKNANKRVNALLTQARRIQNTLTTQKISCGNTQYSLADLCGVGDSGKNFFTAVLDTKNTMSSNMKNTVKQIEEGLTQEQRIAIWKKYGISPQNYIFVQQSVATVKDSASKVIAKATDEAYQLRREEQIAKSNAILEAAYSQTDSNGNMTEAAASEANLHLTQQVIDELGGVQDSINDLANVTATKMIAEENQKQVEADELITEQKKQEAFDNKVPDSFRK